LDHESVRAISRRHDDDRVGLTALEGRERSRVASVLASGTASACGRADGDIDDRQVVWSYGLAGWIPIVESPLVSHTILDKVGLQGHGDSTGISEVECNISVRNELGIFNVESFPPHMGNNEGTEATTPEKREPVE